MTDQPSAVATIAGAPPSFSAADARSVARDYYGFDVASIRTLVSERDQNFRLTLDDGRQFVLKIAGAEEPAEVTDRQIAALEHVASRARGIAPTVIRTLDGARRLVLTKDGRTHLCRLVTYLAGAPLAERPLSAALCESFGTRLAELDLALVDFSSVAAEQELLWDMKQAPKLLRLLEHVPDKAVRALLRATLTTFERDVLPQFPRLRWQPIHNDANPANVLVAGDDATVNGIIDFGDMLDAPVVVDVAVAAAYLRSLEGDVFEYIRPFVAAYDATNRLAESELSLLHELIQTRLATTVVMMYWRTAARDDNDPYLQQTVTSEGGALSFLKRMADVPSQTAHGIYRATCGR